MNAPPEPQIDNTQTTDFEWIVEGMMFPRWKMVVNALGGRWLLMP